MMSPNRSEHITVEKCDEGPLIFNVNKNGKPDWSNQWSKYVTKLYTPDQTGHLSLVELRRVDQSDLYHI